MNTDGEASNKPTIPGRQRTRQACEPCRSMKRKCDGRLPCSVCQRFEYECYFEPQARKRQRTGKDAALETSERPQTEPPSNPSQTHSRSAEMSENAATPRPLAAPNEPTGPHQLLSLTWNLGLREKPMFNIQSLSDLSITHDVLSGLAAVFFEKVHPLYGFMDIRQFQDRLAHRFSEKPQDTRRSDSYDAVLCGVAAIGALFGGGDAHEQELAECARQVLEVTNVSEPPALDHLVAWLIRTLYLRYTSAPHAAWISSCTAMHLAEALGLHMDENTIYSGIDSTTEVSTTEADRRRRLFWVALVLNTSISGESGRSKVELRTITCRLPLLNLNDHVMDLIYLYQQAGKLRPDNAHEPSELEVVLGQVESFAPRHDALVLSQTNLVFSIYRKLRSATHLVSRGVLDKVISQGQKGLKAATELASSRQPWWHCSYIPFQFLCALLAIDTKESLALVVDALDAMQLVTDQFDTHTTREMLRTAGMLVHAFKQRKEDAAKVLSRSLGDEYYLRSPPREELEQQAPQPQAPQQVHQPQQFQHPQQHPPPYPPVDRQARLVQASAMQPMPQQLGFDGFDPMDFSDPNWDMFSNIEFPIFDSSGAPGPSGAH